MLETGVDIIEIDRIDEAVRRHGARFVARVFTPGEVEQCAGKAESLAARFAAKEAVFKALGVRVGWCEVEIQRDESGKPRLVLHGRALQRAREMGIRRWSVSLSHSRQNAVAVVVATD